MKRNKIVKLSPDAELDIKIWRILHSCNYFTNLIANPKVTKKVIKEQAYNLHLQLEPVIKDIYKKINKSLSNPSQN